MFDLLVRITASASLVITFAWSSAAQAASCLNGVWTGTIGNASVTIEFPESDSDDGYYHYGNSLQELILRRLPGKADHFQEFDPKNKLSGELLLRCSGEELAGEWMAPDGNKHSLIRATRSTSDYWIDRLTTVQPKVRATGRSGLGRYESLRIPEAENVEGLRLIGKEAGIAEINRQLKKGYIDGLQSQLSCKVFGKLAGNDTGYGYDMRTSVTAWNRQYVVVETGFDSYCGQAHPYTETHQTVYNLQTGRSEDVAQWLDTDYQDDIFFGSPLGELLSKNYLDGSPDVDEAECSERISFSGRTVSPTPDGLLFEVWMPYSMRAHCAIAITISYKKLKPYLSPVGKRAIKAFAKP